jgi:hypothetical protein
MVLSTGFKLLLRVLLLLCSLLSQNLHPAACGVCHLRISIYGITEVFLRPERKPFTLLRVWTSCIGACSSC